MMKLYIGGLLILAGVLGVGLLRLLLIRRGLLKRVAELARSREQLLREREDQEESGRELRAQVESYLATLSSDPHMLLVYPIDGEAMPQPITFANPLACESLGYADETLHGMTILDIETVTEPETAALDAGELDLMSLGNKEGLGNASRYAMQHIQEMLGRVLEGPSVHYQTRFVSSSGKIIPVSARLECVRFAGVPTIRVVRPL